MRFIVVVFVVGSLWGCRDRNPVPVRGAPLPELHGVDGSVSVGVDAAALRCAATFDTFALPHGASCPLQQLEIDSGRVEIASFDAPLSGTESRVWFSADRRFVVKTVNDIVPIVPQLTEQYRRAFTWIYSSLCKERAVSSAIGDLNGHAARIHPIAPHQLSPSCEAATAVFDFAGRFPFADLASMEPAEQATAAAAAVALLRSVHATGLIHGDVHENNFVFASRRDVGGSLRIIDFGRASRFVTAEGRHVAPGAVALNPFLNRALLSPWELRGETASRRDDLFRLAETLLRVARLEGVPALCTAELPIEGCVNAKLAPRSGGAIAEFYNEMAALDFTKRPDYEYWIARFTYVAKHGGYV